MGVRHRLLGGEGLRGDDEEGLRRVERLRLLDKVGGVDVGDEVDGGAVGEGLERLRNHDGAEIGAADADVDDVGDFLSGEAFPFSGSDGVGEGAHLLKHLFHARHDVLPFNVNGAAVEVPEGGVEDGALFGEINDCARKHALSPFLDVGVFREVEEEAHGVGGDSVFGIIEEGVADAEGEFVETLLVPGEEFAQGDLAHAFAVAGERFPGFRFNERDFLFRFRFSGCSGGCHEGSPVSKKNADNINNNRSSRQ